VIADEGSNRVVRLGVDGLLTLIAGNGQSAFSEDGELASVASLRNPIAVNFDLSGNLLIAERDAEVVRKVDRTTGKLSTVAGLSVASSFAGDGGPATYAAMRETQSVVIDNAGNLFIADINNSRVRKVDGVTGLISTYAGTDRCCNSADGVAAVDSNVRPFALALDGQNNLLIADNNRVRRVDGDSGIIVTVAGNGQWGYGGDGGGALDARFSTIRGLAIDSSGNIFIADHGNHRVRKIDSATGVITTLAGNGRCDAFVEGSQATNASICGPAGLSLRGKDLLIASEWGNRIHRVDLVTGTMTTVAGSGGWGFAGDGASALEANFRHPTDVQVDAQGNLFIVDRANQRIRRVDGSTGIISSVAGIGTPGFSRATGARRSKRCSMNRSQQRSIIPEIFISPTLRIVEFEWFTARQARRLGPSRIARKVAERSSPVSESESVGTYSARRRASRAARGLE